ncbi:MAG TPA: ORF6N domain-containing protein [Candidatus Omnitrophota bacterium]|nr:ORF6N domain-containing protein [Candidatus Omnitrophota bacterium]
MKTEQLQTQKIAASIHLVRSHKVMLDTDLARMYGVETKYLKRQVNRNRERFPSDFMFTLRKHEVMRLRCQIGTLDRLGRGKHTKYLPYVFTEHGILMLSSVLNSPRAVQVNIAITRAFVRLREILSTNKDLAHKFLELERRVGDHDDAIRNIILTIRKMLDQPSKPKGPIGFHP